MITFEGTEGAGKSTLIERLSKSLTAAGWLVVVTREPGGTPVSETLRSLLLSKEMHPRTELLLYEAARAEHVERVIKPALEKGALILCDRYTDSSLAYQAHARGLDWNEVIRLNRFATDTLTPEITVWVDLDPAVGLARATDANRFEAEGLAFQKKVRAGFLRARKRAPSRWITVRSDKLTPDAMHTIVEQSIQKRLRTKSRPK